MSKRRDVFLWSCHIVIKFMMLYLFYFVFSCFEIRRNHKAIKEFGKRSGILEKGEFFFKGTLV